MYLHNLRANLQSISTQSHDTTLLTSDNVHVPTNHHLLAAVSPYLASLLAQGGQGTTISLPFTSNVVTRVMEVLVAGGKEDNDTLKTDIVEAAYEMGILCLIENSEKMYVDVNNVDEVDTSTADIANKLSEVNVNSEINISTFGGEHTKPRCAFNREPELKQEEFDYDKIENKDAKDKEFDYDHIEDKDAKDFILCIGVKSKTKKNKSRNERSNGSKSYQGETKNTICDVCGKVFLTIGIRNTHMKTEHAVSKPFFCGQCDKSFSTAGIRKTHISNRHLEDGTLHLPCEECGKIFPHAKSLNQHVEFVHKSKKPLPSPCPQCAKPVRYLNTHLQHAHSTIRNFGCEECGKMFKTKGDVNDHKKSHLPEEIKLLMKSKQKEKNQCETCGEGFTDSTKLKRHVAIKHTGIKSFLCQKCPASYFRKDHLKSHVASNHGEMNMF